MQTKAITWHETNKRLKNRTRGIYLVCIGRMTQERLGTREHYIMRPYQWTKQQRTKWFRLTFAATFIGCRHVDVSSDTLQTTDYVSVEEKPIDHSFLCGNGQNIYFSQNNSMHNDYKSVEQHNEHVSVQYIDWTRARACVFVRVSCLIIVNETRI